MRRWIAALATVALSCPTLAQTGLAPAGRLTKAQFDKLPPTHVLTIDGKRMTKAEFQAILAKVRSEVAKVRPAPSAGQLAAETARKRSAAVAARNGAALQRALARAKAMPANWAALALAVKAPHIANVDLDGPLTPGSAVFIFGDGFGEGAPATPSGSGSGLNIPSDPCWYSGGGYADPPPGAEARLYGNFAGGYLKLKVSNWHPGCVTAGVPTVSGVLAQQAALRVVAPTGQSNGFPVPFEPTSTCNALEVRVSRCNDLSVPPANPECTLEPGSWPVFRARHTGHTWRVDGSDVTEIALPLKNGWQLQRAWLGEFRCIGDAVECAAYQHSLEVGATSARATFRWSYWSFLDDSAGVTYNAVMEACGPAGTPYK